MTQVFCYTLATTLVHNGVTYTATSPGVFDLADDVAAEVAQCTGFYTSDTGPAGGPDSETPGARGANLTMQAAAGTSHTPLAPGAILYRGDQVVWAAREALNPYPMPAAPAGGWW